VKYKPIRSRYKVIIIDEVHMLTKEAFNALLKTLEEPPPGTVFIFATTELSKVPPTILSRCQVFEFKRPSPRDIVGHLADIAGKENLTISPGGLGLIAEASEGSIRDSLSLLDQAVAFCGETIKDEELKKVLGTVNRDLLFEFSTAVLEEKPELIFALTAKVLNSGYDLRIFLKELVQHFRNLLVVKSVKKPGDLITLLSPEEHARLRTESEKGGEDDLLRYLQALQNAEAGLKFSSHPQIYFETTLVKLCHFRKLVSLKDILQDLEDPKKGGPGAGTAEPRPSNPAWTPPATPRRADPPASLRDSFRPKPSAPDNDVAPAKPAPAGPPPASPSSPAPAASNPPSPRKTLEEAALQAPGVKSFMDKFKARVITIDELKATSETEEN
jgi:DNA polymerase-3 subunit gamma/tau